jgi:hypothetical protein
MSTNKNSLIPSDRILSEILFVRGKKVMLDKNLAELYQVETGALNRAVKRNIERFPADFMFQLTKNEAQNLICQFGTSNLISQFVISSHGGTRKLPYAFTEQGVAMLSSVLNSKRAIMVNIQIIRIFTQLRELLATNTKFRTKIESMEKKYDSQLKKVFDILKQLLMKEEKPKQQIGFRR